MVWLMVTVLLFSTGPQGTRVGQTLRLEFPTKYTCEHAQVSLDLGLLEQAAKRWYATRHKGKVARLFSECKRNELVDPVRECDKDWRATCSNSINRI